MNIDVIRIRFKDNYGDDEYSYKYLPFEYCCDKLKNCDYIVFSNDYDYLEPDEHCDVYDNTTPGFSIWREEPQAWEELPHDCYYRIGYCPFCGQKININTVREEDKSADYSTMSTLRGLLKKRCDSTDSKKECDKLNKEIKELDRKINEMWNFGEYKWDTLKYKGYEGSVEYSPEDKVYHGKILNTKDLVDYNSETEDDIENQFHLAVDDYLEFKKEISRDD